MPSLSKAGISRNQMVIAGGLAVVLASLISLWLEPLVGDRAIALAPTPDADTRAQIVLVTITEDTLATFPYRSPIDRGFLADLITRLDAAEPRAIGVDILLDQPSEPAKDTRLISALDAAKTQIALADADERDGLSKRQAEHLTNALQNRQRGWIALERDESDGIVRHIPRPRRTDGARVPSFAEALVGVPPGDLTGRILFSAASDAAPAFAAYPAQTVHLLPDDWFTDKLILIGIDVPTLDRHPTPLVATKGAANGTLPGLAIHAHIAAQLLAGTSLTPSSLSLALLLCIAVVSAILVLGARTQSAGLLWSGLALILSVYAIIAGFVIASGSALPPLIGPPLAALFAAVLIAFARWRADRAERAFLHDAFSRYVSPAVVDRISSRALPLVLGGEKREVTYLFTDLEGFTTLSEHLPPETIAPLLNGYLDAMCEQMVAHGATIDKIIGDAIVGFFGAPDDDPDQSTHAVDLALALDACAQAHREKAKAQGIALGVTRIGIHRGPAVIGNFGGSRFFDYTGIGDTVNTAARLEGANKPLGTRILVSETVAATTNRAQRLRPAAQLVLKGRTTPLACFEVLAQERSRAHWIEDYDAAYDLLEDRPEDAAKVFTAVLEQCPSDPLARFHLDRLRMGAKGATVVLDSK